MEIGDYQFITLARFNLGASNEKKGAFTGMPIPAGAYILASFVLFSEHIWDGLVNFDVAVALLVTCSAAMVSVFKYGVMPRISFATGKHTVKSVWVIGFLILVAIFPDELFFPIGIVYLLSGPVRYLSTPAFNHVFHKANTR